MLIEDLTKAVGGSKDRKPLRPDPGSIEIRTKAPTIKPKPVKVQPKNLKPTILPPVIGIPPRFQKKADPAPFKPIPPIPPVISPGQAAIDDPSAAIQPLQQKPGIGQAVRPQGVPDPSIEDPEQGIPADPGEVPQPVPLAPPVPKIPSVPATPQEIPLQEPKPDTIVPFIPVKKPKPAVVPPLTVPVPKIDPPELPPLEKPVAPPIVRPKTEPAPVLPDIQPYVPKQDPIAPNEMPSVPDEIELEPLVPVKPERKKEEPEEQQPEKPEEIKPAAIQNSRIIYPQAAIPQTTEEQEKYAERVATEAIKTFMIIPGSDKSLDKIAKELNIKPADLKDYNPNYKKGNPVIFPQQIAQNNDNIVSINQAQRYTDKTEEDLKKLLKSNIREYEKDRIREVLKKAEKEKFQVTDKELKKAVGSDLEFKSYNVIGSDTGKEIDSILQNQSSTDSSSSSKVRNITTAKGFGQNTRVAKDLRNATDNVIPFIFKQPKIDSVEQTKALSALKNLKIDLGIEAGDMAKRLGKAALNSPVFLAYGFAVDLLNPPELNAKEDLDVRNIQLNDLITNLNEEPSKNLEENTKKQEQVIEFFLTDKWKSNALEEKIDPAISIIKPTVDDTGNIVDAVVIKGENLDQLDPKHLATGPYIAKDIDKLIESTNEYRNKLQKDIVDAQYLPADRQKLVMDRLKRFQEKIQMLQEVKNELPPTRGIALRNFLTNQLKLERLQIPTDQEKQEDVDVKPVIIDFKIANDLDQAIKNKDNESILDSIDSRNNSILQQTLTATSNMFHVILPADIGNQLYERTKRELDELYTKYYDAKLLPNTEPLQDSYKKLIQKLQFRFQSLGAYVSDNEGNTGIQAQLNKLKQDLFQSSNAPAGVQFNDNGKKYIELLSNKYGLPSVKPLLSIYANESSSGKFLKGDLNPNTKQYDSVGGLHVNIGGGFAQYKSDINPNITWNNFKDNHAFSTEVGVWYYNSLLTQTRREKLQNNWPDNKIVFFSKDGKPVEELTNLQGVPVEFIYAAIRYNGGPGKVDKNTGRVTIPLNKNEITPDSNILGYAKKFIKNYKDT